MEHSDDQRIPIAYYNSQRSNNFEHVCNTTRMYLASFYAASFLATCQRSAVMRSTRRDRAVAISCQTYHIQSGQ